MDRDDGVQAGAGIVTEDDPLVTVELARVEDLHRVWLRGARYRTGRGHKATRLAAHAL